MCVTGKDFKQIIYYHSIYSMWICIIDSIINILVFSLVFFTLSIALDSSFMKINYLWTPE